jgi:hypothetical protein
MVLLMPGNKGFSFDRLVGACIEMSTVNDSQLRTTAR